jgi:hypothetical protein
MVSFKALAAAVLLSATVATSQVLAHPLIDTGRTVLDNAPIVQVQPRALGFLPGSSADQAEQRRESKFDAKQRKLDEAFDNNLNICTC